MVLLLASRATPVACAVSGAIYAYGWFVPAATTFPERAMVPGYVNWATWQALFAGSIIIGWHWQAPVVARALASSRALAAAAAACVLLGIAGYAATRRGAFAGQPWGDAVDRLFGNGRLGPGAIVFALLAVYVLYVAARRALALPAGRRALMPLAHVGQRSLGAYVLIGVVALVYPVLRLYRPDGIEGAVLALAVLALVLIWAARRAAPTAQSPHSSHQGPLRRVGG